MELLQKPADRGYPADYLLARIKGRRSKLIRNWKSLLFDADLFGSSPFLKQGRQGSIASPEGIWGNLMAEYRWVYGQMDQGLRDIFYPYLLYAELRTMFICLKRLPDRKAGAIDELLNRSLLSDEVKNVLLLSADTSEAVIGIEQLFSGLTTRFVGLSEVLPTEGLRGVEQRFVEIYLSEEAASASNPLMRMFFSRLVDARNIMGIYKYLRLELKAAPHPIPGGGICEAKLQELARKADITALGQAIREFTGTAVERPDPTSIEMALYRGMTKWLGKEGRAPFGVAPILDYLWRSSIEATNLSVLFHAQELERDMVSAELVM